MRYDESTEIEETTVETTESMQSITTKIFMFIKEIVVVVAILLFITNFIAIHAKVPSGSMIPTIEIGDHFIVNRLAYLFGDVKRQDIIVFKGFDGTLMVKRVIGLPGDIVDLIDGEVHINGEPLDESAYLSEEVETWPSSYISFPLLVPKGEYFVMGDNRGNSFDSRYFNTIKEEAIIGNGKLRVYPFTKMGIIK